MELEQQKAQKILRPTAVNIKKAASVMRSGGLVIFPTDTVYGIGCDAFNVNAVKKIFLAKKRKENKALPILIANIKQLEILVKEIPPLAKELIKKYWPGQLTIVFYKNKKVSSEVTANSDKVAVRWPKNRIATDLIKELQLPIIGTSANLSGQNSILTVNDIPESLLDSVDLILDGGTLKSFGVSSTIIDVTSNPPQILREGAVNLKDEI
ncbi:MAG: L-threonylcarbamoyladenylate synthase [Patescibacteria group bacterium]